MPCSIASSSAASVARRASSSGRTSPAAATATSSLRASAESGARRARSDVGERLGDVDSDPVRVGDSDDAGELDRVERVAAAHRMEANEARPRERRSEQAVDDPVNGADTQRRSRRRFAGVASWQPASASAPPPAPDRWRRPRTRRRRRRGCAAHRSGRPATRRRATGRRRRRERRAGPTAAARSTESAPSATAVSSRLDAETSRRRSAAFERPPARRGTASATVGNTSPSRLASVP